MNIHRELEASRRIKFCGFKLAVQYRSPLLITFDRTLTVLLLPVHLG